MSPTDLRSIRTFPSLVKYLRDELDWPIETDDFDDLTFDYRPEELGIDPKTAASIEEIKQLRPLVANQPWGIFFIKFEPKKLPVVVLRRILRTLVIKKRASASQSHQATWSLHDLLFISSYGKSDHRDITFAHFTESAEMGDLPALRVLGWDDEDTVLHLEHAHKVLREKLRWPGDPHQVDEWSEQWSSAFTLKHMEVITTSKDLAIQLAHLATAIRKRVSKVLSIETESGPLHRLMKSFKKALIHDLYEEAFADMYAQTITYGLLSARVSRPAGLVAENITDMVPTTNPFLKDLLSTFLTVGGRKGNIDFDELGINEVVHALRDANMEAVLRDFGDRNPQEDPVIHFYELFLKEYNPELRMQRGVFYTPRPVVSFIVRSVDEILRSEFALQDGLADTSTWGEMLTRFPEMKLPKDTSLKDPFVQVLDPALGTGTFLVEVINIIHKTMTTKWQKVGCSISKQEQLWNEYVPKHLLPRLYGFELLMAPYAIAHMKIGLKLGETGYRFTSDERARVYLTNSLEPPSDIQMDLPDLLPALAHEAQAVNEVKRQKRFTIVIGNPPYSIVSANQNDWIATLCEPYKENVRKQERQIQALSDDYVKFLRLGEWVVCNTGGGVLGMITNNGFLDGHLFVDMRRHQAETFHRMSIVNLHGNLRTGERTPDGLPDGNVFDIQTGVTISLGVRTIRSGSNQPRVLYCDLWGSREAKYENLCTYLPSTLEQVIIRPQPPSYLFLPSNTEIEHEWKIAKGLLDIFGTGNPRRDRQRAYAAGFVSQQDDFAIAFTKKEIESRVAELLDPQMTEGKLRQRYKLCTTNQWSFSCARSEMKREDISKLLTTCTYRPFDTRWTVFHRGVVSILRKEVMRHLCRRGNLALLATRGISRQVYAHVFVSNTLTDRHAIDNASESMFVFPVYIYPTTDKEDLFGSSGRGAAAPQVNMDQHLLEGLATSLGLTLTDRGNGDLKSGLGPVHLFRYLYAVLHSLGYRNRYESFLTKDFPRIPFTSDLGFFRSLVKLGGELVALHLMESPKLDRHITTFIGKSSNEVVKVRHEDQTVWINSDQGFKGVPEDVWNFHIGGYQVCEKWLKDRKGRRLSEDDITHYHKIVVAFNETIHLMGEIDKVIEKHGGWPGAFITQKQDIE